MTNNYSYRERLTTGLRQWWLMLMGIILLTLSIGVRTGTAQSVTNYAFSATSGTFTPIAGTVGSTNLAAIQADFGTSGLLPIGFNFLYNGVYYSQFFAHSDGYIGLGGTVSGTAANDLTTGISTSRPILAPYWDDISGALPTGTGTFATTGSVGNRVLTVEFLNWKVNYSGPVATSFQVKLYEATGAVQFVYRQEAGAPATASASIGITAPGTGSGNFLSLNNTSASPTASSTTETNTIATVPATGQTYTFTPPVAPPAPTGLSFSAISNNSMTLDWVDATGETGYIIERSLDGVTYTRVATLAANSISYNATGLSASQTYYWNVRSINEGQASAALNSSQATSAGTICGTYSVGPTGTYASLTAALNDIRTNGLSCSVILELQAAYTSSGETFPIWTGNLGSIAGKTVTIRPEAGATGLLISGSNASGIVLDSLTNYVNFDGRPGGVGSVSELTIQNINTTASAFTNALRIVQESSNNAHSFIIFRGASTSTANGVVYLGGSTVAGGSGNDNNSFDNCDFRDAVSGFPVNGFYALGQSALILNDNCSITNSRVYNFFSATLATNGVNIQANNNAWTVSGNRFYQDASRTYGTGNLHRAIVLNSTSGGNFTVSNNIIGFANAAGTGTYTMTFITTAVANRFFGMDINCGVFPSFPVSTISNNQISDILINTSSSGTGSGAGFVGIWLNSGNANISGNTVGSLTTNNNILMRSTVTSGSATGGSMIGIAQGAATVGVNTVTNNNIGGLSFDGITAAFLPAPAVGATIIGLFNQGATTLLDAGSYRTISGNTIGGSNPASLRAGNANQVIASMTANFSVVGILNTGATRINITGNTIQNFEIPTRSTAGVMYGIHSTTGLPNYSGNIIRNFFSSSKNVGTTTAATIIGLSVSATSTPVTGTSVNISGNQIYNLNSRADSSAITMSGISFSGAATAGFSFLIQKNLVYDLQDITNPAGAGDVALQTINGIAIQGGVPTVQNNMVRLGVGTPISHTYNGILKNVAQTVAPINIWHNSVFIGGASTVNYAATPAVSAAFRRSLASASQNDDIRNNIFANFRTSAITNQFNYGIALNANTFLVLDKNIYFADTLTNGRTGLTGVTTAIGLAAWRTACGADASSIFEDPKYVAPVASTPDLHLQVPPALVPAEQAGAAIAAVTDDFDGDVRAANTPDDIGADAGNYLASGDYKNPVFNSLTYSPLGGQCTAVARTVTADLADGSGFSLVRINWSMNGVAQTAITMSNTSGSIWEGTIPANGSSIISFTVTAIDASVNLNATTSSAFSYQDEYLKGQYSLGPDLNVCPGANTTLSIAPLPAPTGYLASSATNPADEEILNVTFGALNNTSSCITTGGAGSTLNLYSNYTALSPTYVAPGQVVSFSLQVGTCGGNFSNRVAIFIDYNRDGDFLDAGENPFISNATTGPNTQTGTVTIPVTASLGGTRLRVIAVETTGAIASTGTYTWGETEDYTIVIGNIITSYLWSPGGATTSSIVVNPTVNTEYIVSFSDGVCTSGDTINLNMITTLPAPVGTNGGHCGAQVPTCSISSVVGATSYRWYDAPTGGTLLQNNISLTYLSPVSVTTTFYVAAFDGVCEGPRVAVTETVTQPDAIDIVPSPNDSICLGSSAVLTVNQSGSTNTYTYIWSGSGTGSLNTNTGSPVTSLPTSTGNLTFIVTATDAGAGCVTTDTLLLSVFNNPFVSVTPATTTICESESVTISTLAYSFDGSSSAPIGYAASAATNTIDEDINGVSIGSLNNTQAAPNCALYTDYTALPAPALAPGSTYPVTVSVTDCELSGFFSAGTAVYVDWNRDGDFADAGELAYTNNTTINGPHVVNGSVTVPLTASAGLTRMRVVVTEGSLIPAATGTYGYGETEDYLVLIANQSGLNFSWSPTSGVSNPAIAAPVITPTSTGLTSYVLTVTTAQGCSASDNVDITVNPAPAAPTATNSTQCGSGIPAASVSNTGASAYFWFDAPTGGNVLQSGPSLTYTSSISTSKTFYVSAFNGTCYSTPRTVVTATVTPVPYNVVVSASDSSLCEGSNLILLIEPTAILFYNNFSWSVNAGGNVNNVNSDNTTATPSTAGTYNYVFTATDGFCTSVDTVTVIVSANPTISTYTISDTTLCQGSSAILTGAGIPSGVSAGPQTPPTGYAASGATNTIDEDINGVSIGTLNNAQAAPNCATYTDYTALPAPTLLAGATYPVTVSVTDCELSGFFSAGTAVYIDYNRNGVFDAAELAYTNNTTINGPHIVNGSVTIPLTASPGVTRMRVVNTEGSLIPAATGTYGYGETEDYNVNIIAYNPASIQYSWSGAGTFGTPSAATTTFTPSGLGTTSVTLTVTDITTGCTASQVKDIVTTAVPAAPTCAPVVRCGPGSVTMNASANGPGNGNLFWTEDNGGNVIGFGNSLTKNVSGSETDYVREFPTNLDSIHIGYNPVTNLSAAAGYFPTTTQGMWFNVDNAGGVYIKSVDIIPNGPVGSPVTIAIIDSLGNVIGTKSTVTTITNVGTAGPFYAQTVYLDIFVPYSTTPYAIRPLVNPNLAVHQNATVAASSPWQINGDIRIRAYGNMPPAASFFTNTTFGFFYNWNVYYGCFGSACANTITVNTAPTLAIQPSSATFCDSGTVVLDAVTGSDPSYINFSWSPASGLTSTTGGAVTANVYSTTTYTVTADDGVSGPTGCANTASVTLTVNPGPFANTGVVPDTICKSTALQLNGTGAPTSYKYVGTTINPGQTAGWPFNGANLSQKMEVYVSAAELNAAGLFGPTFIQSVGFNVVNKLSNQPYNGFTVKVGNIPSGFGCFFATTFYEPTFTAYTGNYSTVTGWNDLVFQNAYAWDGVSDIVIQTCFTNTTTSFFDIVYTTSTGTCNSTNAINASACSATTGALLTLRPNMRFQGGAVNYSWSPSGELSAANIRNPIFNPGMSATVGPRQLVLTVTDPASTCSRTDTVNFYVKAAPTAPSIAFVGNDTTVCITGTLAFSGSYVDGSLQWQESTDGVTFTDISGAVSANYTTPTLTATKYYRLAAYCGIDSTYSNVKMAKVNNPQILSTNATTVCGQGNVTFSATTGAGYFTQWFSDSTSSVVLSNSNSYTTFITQTDTFWVRATVDTNSTFGGGPAPSYCAVTNAGSSCVTNVTINTLNYNQATCASPYYDIIPEATATTQLIPGQTYSLSVTCQGTAIVSVWIDYNRDGLFDASEWNQVYTAAATGSINVTVPANAAGGKTGMRIRSRLNGNQNGAGDACLAMGSGSTQDFVVSIGLQACSSAKVPVISTVIPAPPISLNTTSATICEGDSVLLLDLTGNYTGTYSWSPALTIVNAADGSAYAKPSVTTTYTLTGNNGVCQNSAAAVITVNPAPVFSISTATPSLCTGDTATIGVTVTSPVSTNYVVTPITYAPTVIAGAAGPDGDDNVATYPIGFNFTFYGVSYSNVVISTNGFISFDASPGSGCCSGQVLPNALIPNNLIALGWEDLTATPGQITYATIGSAPNRVFIVNYNAVAHLSGTGTPLTGQIKLFEGTNIAEVHTAAYSDDGTITTQGVENAAGTTAAPVPGRNGVTGWVANNDAFRFSLPSAATVSWSGQNIIGPTNTASIQANPTVSGYYVATVTNPNTGCTKQDSVLISFASTPQPNIITPDQVLCGGAPAIDVVVQDLGTYAPPTGYPANTTFAWYNAAGIQSVPATIDLDTVSSSLASSFYAVVTLPNGCSATSDTAYILTKSVSVNEIINPGTCAAPGSVIATAGGTGASGPFRFLWSSDLAQTNILRDELKSDPNDFDDTLLNAAGTVYLQVFDTANAPVFSCNSGVLTYNVGGTAALVIDSVLTTNITCNGFADGTATVYYTGGSSPYSIVWSDGQGANLATRNSLSGGTYTVTVSGGAGCADTASFTIAEPGPLTLNLTTTPETPAGALNGTITAAPTGGTLPYTISLYDVNSVFITSGGPTFSGLAAGDYIVVIEDSGLVCNYAELITVTSLSVDTFDIKLLIEGFSNGAGGMVPALFNSSVSLDDTECDTIRVELRDGLSPTTVLASAIVVMDTAGKSQVIVPATVVGQNGYIAIFHRNAVQTWSDLITFTASMSYDFTTAATQSYGPNMIEILPGKWAFYSGDVDQDEFIGLADQGIVDNDVFNFAGGYLVTDLDGDAFVGLNDQGIQDNNIFNFIGSIHP